MCRGTGPSDLIAVSASASIPALIRSCARRQAADLLVSLGDRGEVEEAPREPQELGTERIVVEGE